eukprot:scaffold181657_cov34-Prasinocladus_malaysianus.AAC.1
MDGLRMKLKQSTHLSPYCFFPAWFCCCLECIGGREAGSAHQESPAGGASHERRLARRGRRARHPRQGEPPQHEPGGRPAAPQAPAGPSQVHGPGSGGPPGHAGARGADPGPQERAGGGGGAAQGGQAEPNRERVRLRQSQGKIQDGVNFG